MPSQKEKRDNVKKLIEELLTLSVNLPKKSVYRSYVNEVLNWLHHEVPLKSIILQLQEKLKINNPKAKNATFNQDREFWLNVLKMFTNLS